VPGPEERLSGGALNAALANELGRLIADFTGRGAQRSRAFVDQDVVVCILEDGATNAERNLVSAGRADLVRDLRCSGRGLPAGDRSLTSPAPRAPSAR
jgi:uncharacterized protein YbcI